MAQQVKAGDVVHVRAVVKRIGVCGLPVIDVTEGAFDPSKSELHVCHEGIVHVEPRPLQVGDKVTWGSAEYNFFIRSIVDGHALLEREDRTVWWAHPVAELAAV